MNEKPKLYKLTIDLSQDDRKRLEEVALTIFPVKVSKSRLAAMWIRERLEEYHDQRDSLPVAK